MVGSRAVCSDRARAGHPPLDSCRSMRTRQISARIRSSLIPRGACSTSSRHSCQTAPGQKVRPRMPRGTPVLSPSKTSIAPNGPTTSSGQEELRISATTQTALRGEKVEEVRRPNPAIELRGRTAEEVLQACRRVAVQRCRHSIRSVSPSSRRWQPMIATTRMNISSQPCCEKLPYGSRSISMRDSSTRRRLVTESWLANCLRAPAGTQ